MQAEAFTFTQTISELDELQEIVKGSDLEHTQLRPGQFHAQTTRIDLGASFLDVGEYNLAIRARGSIGSEFVTFFFMPRQEGNSNGFPVNNEQFVAFGSGATADAYGASNPEWMTLTVRRDEWLGFCRDLDHWAARLDEPRAFSVAPPPQLMTGLLQTLQSVADLAGTKPTLFSQASVRQFVHQELMSRIRHCLSTTDSTLKKQVKIPLHRRYQIVKRAESYVLAHLDRRIYVADLCEYLGISERSLQYAFRGVWGVSPFEYLTVQRLNKARRELRRATPGQTTVTNVAIECGFWHLGRFSGAYKALFGDSPSDTLKQRGDQ
jgi:AraC-like DNA-binding protein